MMTKSKVALLISIFTCLLVIILGISVFAYLNLPAFLEKRIIPSFAEDFDIREYSVDVRSVDFWEADLANLRLGPKHSPAFLVESVRISYEPFRLLDKQISKIVFSGIELYCELKDGRYTLRGFDLQAFLENLGSQAAEPPRRETSEKKLAIAGLQIKNTTIICEIDNQTYRIPLESDIFPDKHNPHAYQIVSSFYPRGQKIFSALSLDSASQQFELNLSAENMNIASFSDLFRRFPGLSITGDTTLKARATGNLSPFQIASMESRIVLQKGDITYDGLQFHTPERLSQTASPLVIRISTMGGREWNLQATELESKTPIPLRISDFSCRINPLADGFESRGDFKTVFLPTAGLQNTASPLKITDPISIPVTFSAAKTANNRLEFKIENSVLPKTARATYRQFNLHTQVPKIEIAGRSEGGRLRANCNLSARNLQIKSAGGRVALPDVNFQGVASVNQTMDAIKLSGLKLNLPNALMDFGKNKMTVKDITLNANAQIGKNSKLGIDGLIRLVGGNLKLGQQTLTLHNLRVSLPVKWPAVKSSAKGNFSISTANHKKLDLGGLKGTIYQTRSGLAFNGNYTGKLVPGLSARFSGFSSVLPPGEIALNTHVDIHRSGSATEFNLGQILPGMAGTLVRGEMRASADLSYDKRGFQGNVLSEISSGSFRMPQEGIALEGIQGALNIPNLPLIRSAPKQPLSFSKASLGRLLFTNGDIDFQIESLNSFFIERSHFNWCNGKVDLQAMRIKPGVEDYDIILFCDRLNLAQVLEQFGATSAEGNGAVNGKIPLHYKNGKLRFGDGFLFSTPGDGGKIRISGTEKLTAGIPPNTPQYTQMALASEALKDYDYKWAKLRLSSEGDDFLLQMQMDGKPANLLPFVYSKDIGGFTRIEVEGQGSNFQGIRLDVNFRLPLDKILQYKNIIKMIQ